MRKIWLGFGGSAAVLIGILGGWFWFSQTPELSTPVESIAIKNTAQIEFSTAPDKNIVAEMIQIQDENLKPVPGFFRWEGDEKLVFELNNPAEDLTKFSVRFSGPIIDTWGRTFSVPKQIKFIRHADPPALTFQNPKNSAENITGTLPVTLLWSAPVMPLRSPDQSAKWLKDKAQIKPEHPGSWRQLGTTGLLFEPSEPWKGSTKYSVEIGDSVSGEPIEISFSTQLVAFQSISHSDLINRKPVILNFNQPVDRKKIEENIRFQQYGGGDLKFSAEYFTPKPTETEPSPSPVYNEISITPSENWPAKVTFHVVLPVGRYSLEGDLQSQQIEKEFKTAEAFQVNNFSVPETVKRTAHLNFSAPVTSQDFVDHLKIYPEVSAEKWKKFTDSIVNDAPEAQQKYFHFPAPGTKLWTPNETYEIVITPGLTDIHGRTFESEWKQSFSTRYENEVASIYLPKYNAVMTRDVEILPAFKYSGELLSTKVILQNLQTNQSWNKSFDLPQVFDQEEFWQFDLKEVFPAIMDEKSAEFLPGAYRLEAQFTYPPRWGNQKYVQTFSSEFAVSDFSVITKETARDELTIAAQMFDAEKISKVASIAYRQRNYQPKITEEPVQWRKSETVIEFPWEIDTKQKSIGWIIARTADGKVGIGNAESFYENISVYDAKVSYNPDQYQQTSKGVIFPDRPLFKVGDTVHLKSIFRGKSRTDSVFPLQPVSDEKIAGTMKILNPFYEPVWEQTIESSTGSSDVSWQIPIDAPLGQYEAHIKLGEREIFRTNFHVGAYRKPNFLIESGFDAKTAIAGDEISAEISAAYAFGGALSGKSVDYRVTLFGQAQCSWWGWGCAKHDEVILTGSGTLDENGQLKLPVSTDLEAIETSIDWNVLTLHTTVKASDTDQSSQTVSIPFALSEYIIELEPSQYWYEPEARVTWNGTVEDLVKNPIETDVTIALVQKEWTRVERKNPEGDFHGEWTETEKIITTQSVSSDENGKFSADFSLPVQGGQYFVQAQVKDSKARVGKQKSYFWVSGNTQDKVQHSAQNKIVELFPDSDTYELEDSAEIFFPTPGFTIKKAIATLERGSEIRTLPVNLEKQTISLQTEGWMAPNVYVSLLLTGTDKNGDPDIRWGVANLAVTDPSRALEIKLSPAKSVYRPGETIQLDIETIAESGTRKSPSTSSGKAAEITVAVVDQTLLAVKDRPSLNLWQYFLAKLPYGVRLSHTLDRFISTSENQKLLDQIKDIKDRLALGHGGGGGTADAEALVAGKGGANKPRGDFRDTAAFLATIQTDENGSANIEIPLPDNLTTWNIWAIGHTPDNAFGEAETTIRTELPLLVDPIVPRFLQIGDQTEIGVLIRRKNAEKSAENLTVTMAVNDGIIAKEAERTLIVSEEARVFFPIEVPFENFTLGKTDQTTEFIFSITGESAEDSVKVSLPILPPQQTLTAAETLLVKHAQVLNLVVNPEAIAVNLILDLYPSMTNRAKKLIEITENRNYGCAEQRWSEATGKMLQNTFDIERGASPEPIDWSYLEEQQQFLEKSFFQGGFAFWPGNTPSLWLTAQILAHADIWTAYDVEFSAEKIEKSADFLRTQILKNCQPEVDIYCPSDSTRQHAAWVAAQYDKITVNELSFLMAYTRPLEAKIWYLKLINDLETKGQTIPERVAEKRTQIWRNIEQRVQANDRFIFFSENPEERSFYSQDERLTALLYPEIISAEKLKGQQHKLLRYLTESGKENLSGNTALYMLKSLIKAAQTESTENLDAEYLVRWPQIFDPKSCEQYSGKACPAFCDQVALETESTCLTPTVIVEDKTQVKIRGKFTKLEQSETSVTPLKAANPNGDLDIELMSLNEKGYYADIQLQSILPTEASQALSHGFWIDRKIYAIDDLDRKNPRKILTVGENYLVQIQVTNNANQRQVVIEDALPSGAEAINFSFDNANKTLQDLATSKAEGCWFWCRPQFDHQEIHDDRVRFFVSRLPAGTHEITYIIQARIPGTFDLKPAKAEAMYFPEVFGTTPAETIRIKRSEK